MSIRAPRTALKRLAVILPLLIALVAPTPALAITRAQVISRAKVWVKKKVRYSQSRSYQGYRTDCSGFVSMAWKAPRSYTTRTLPRISVRVRNRSAIRPGDMMLQPGHARLFVRWANKSKTKFVAMEESTRRRGTVQRTVSTKGHVAYRYKKIR